MTLETANSALDWALFGMVAAFLCLILWTIAADAWRRRRRRRSR